MPHPDRLSQAMVRATSNSASASPAMRCSASSEPARYDGRVSAQTPSSKLFQADGFSRAWRPATGCGMAFAYWKS